MATIAGIATQPGMREPGAAKAAAPLSRVRLLVQKLLAQLLRRAAPRRRLAVLDRLPLAPKQSLALIEVDGRKMLIATSGDGTPAVYPLDGPAPPNGAARLPRRSRVSW